MNRQKNLKIQAGFSILEVVIGIFIFVVGILALASLQGSLTRSMADSKVHTVAVNLAERQIESIQAFTQLLAPNPADPTITSYNSIVDSTSTAGPFGGVTYTLTQDVTDYYYSLSGDTSGTPFTTTSGGAAVSSYKVVDITVTWTDDREFRLNEGSETSGNLDAEAGINLTAIIPPIVTSAAGRVATATGGDIAAPSVLYTPGENPDIVALTLAAGRFKESLTPMPELVHKDNLVDTRFEVITYSSNNGGTFLRREEFAAVSCECTLRAKSSSQLARRPVVWAGDEYAGGHFVQKAYGESANQQQNLLCDTCCRDHHDGDISFSAGDNADLFYNVFGPFKKSNEYSDGTARISDHKHYTDNMDIVGTGQKYREACRLVRVDGYFRVAQDFRREDQYMFPDDFLDDPAEISTYSKQVTESVAEHQNVLTDGYPGVATPPCIGDNGATCLKNPTVSGASPSMAAPYSTDIGPDELPVWTQFTFGAGSGLGTPGAAEDQQLRSRGVYIDYSSDDLRLFLSSCISNGAIVNDCCVRRNKSTGVGTIANQCGPSDLFLDKAASVNTLEILPFFDVQMTKLENWDQSVQDPLPINVSMDGIANDNSYSRGVISQLSVGQTDVVANSHRGNLGFTNTLAIDPVFDDYVPAMPATLFVKSLDAGGGGGDGGGTDPIVVAGQFTRSVTGDPKITVEGFGGAFCTLVANGYTCSVTEGSTSPTVFIDGYQIHGKYTEDRYACSSTLTRIDSNAVKNNTNATFSLLDLDGNLTGGSSFNITIQSPDDC